MKHNYTCPMHSEVISDKPGSCPKCGMKLVPKEMKMDHGGHKDDKKAGSAHKH